MQTDEAKRLRERWAEKGSPECSHPTVTRERFREMSTGDYICTLCGEEFARSALPDGCSIL